MKKVEGQALGTINKTLGLSGEGAPSTEFIDGELVQSLDVNPYVRRGNTISPNEGIYTTVLRTIDAVGGAAIIATLLPYNATVGAINGWPVPVPPSLDVWVLKAQVANVSGGFTATAALFANYDARQQGLGIDSAGVAVVSSIQELIMFWDLAKLQTFRFLVQDNGGTAGSFVPEIRPFRIPRGHSAPGTSLVFSCTASAAATWECQVLLGLFPSGLGQDVLG